MPSSTSQLETFVGSIIESDSIPSTTASSDSSVDEDEVNRRIVPDWLRYRDLLEYSGFRLDSYRDVKEFYEGSSWFRSLTVDASGEYSRVCQNYEENALCKDAGLPDNLFRGYRMRDMKRIVVKSVNSRSREFHIIRHISSPPLRNHPMNHSIPILSLLEVPQDQIALIVMEEWPSSLVSGLSPGRSVASFLGLIRDCIEHVVFLHEQHIAHLDISMHNFLTNDESRCACIDYETSRTFAAISSPRISDYSRGTEIPPESGRRQYLDPYKVDVWALGILVVRASNLADYCIPQIWEVIRPMLDDDPDRRPTSAAILRDFRKMMSERSTLSSTVSPEMEP